MPKRVFWPVALVTMGLIMLASNLGMLPREFWNLWPLILIVVGLGGLLTSDRKEWLVDTERVGKTTKSSRRSTARKKSQRKTRKTRKTKK